MMDEVVCSVVREAGYTLGQLLRSRQTPENIENAVSAQLLERIKWSLFVSGRNRSLGHSSNVVRRSRQGQYIVLFNALDGHVNYYRGSRLFTGNISVLDTVSQSRYSIVYDGLADQVIEFKPPVRQSLVHKSSGFNKPVLGLWQIVSLNDAILKKAPPLSLRSLGSTTLSILEVYYGKIDVYVSRTKLWNFHWALPLCEKAGLSLLIGPEHEPVTQVEDRLLHNPEDSVLVMCYMYKKYVETLRSILASVLDAYGKPSERRKYEE